MDNMVTTMARNSAFNELVAVTWLLRSFRDRCTDLWIRPIHTVHTRWSHLSSSCRSLPLWVDWSYHWSQGKTITTASCIISILKVQRRSSYKRYPPTQNSSSLSCPFWRCSLSPESLIKWRPIDEERLFLAAPDLSVCALYGEPRGRVLVPFDRDRWMFRQTDRE